MTLWFKAKEYGWGWTPASWQGWLVTAVYIVLLLGLLYLVQSRVMTSTFVAGIIVLTVALCATCYKTGERPRWRWGK